MRSSCGRAQNLAQRRPQSLPPLRGALQWPRQLWLYRGGRTCGRGCYGHNAARPNYPCDCSCDSTADTAGARPSGRGYAYTATVRSS
jgi:hypothetical protein